MQLLLHLLFLPFTDSYAIIILDIIPIPYIVQFEPSQRFRFRFPVTGGSRHQERRLHSNTVVSSSCISASDMK